MARVPFTSVFRTNADGSISPVQQVRIGGVMLSPGITINRGLIIAGLDLTQYTARDFDIETKDGVLVINGIYGQDQ